LALSRSPFSFETSISTHVEGSMTSQTIFALREQALFLRKATCILRGHSALVRGLICGKDPVFVMRAKYFIARRYCHQLPDYVSAAHDLIMCRRLLRAIRRFNQGGTLFGVGPWYLRCRLPFRRTRFQANWSKASLPSKSLRQEWKCANSQGDQRVKS
jgi:hypothetical protein